MTALAIAVSALLLGACGSGRRGTTSPAPQAPTAINPSGEQSVENYGSAATNSDKAAITGVEYAYLSAVAAKDFAAACSHLSASVARNLEQLVAGALRRKGCPAILPAVLAPVAPTTAREQAEGNIERVRIKGRQAFVIFHAPGARLYVFPLVREGGAWKAASLAGSILVP